jgi:signal peptidase
MRTAVENKQAKIQKIKQTILNIILGISIILLLQAAATVLFFRSEDAFFLSYKPFIVAGDSMSPSIKKYAFVLVKNGGYNNLSVGDVIAFKAKQIGGQTALHRIIDVTPDGFVTKGDATRVKDEQFVTEDNFLGREVWYTNLTAELVPMLQTTRGVISVILTLCLLIVIPVIIKMTVRKRMTGQKVSENEDLPEAAYK